MLNRLLYLEPGLLRRCGPFFGLYLLLFAALTLADGLSLALFVQRVGTGHLPAYYALSAVGMVVATAWYMRSAGRHSGAAVFQWILAGPVALSLAVWLLVAVWHGDPRWLGALFLAREIALALVLLHFGTWLLEFFTRRELNRVMPVIYAGGRLGGIVGGAMLEHFSQWVHPLHLLVLLAALLALGMFGVALVQRYVPQIVEEDMPPSATSAARESVEAAPRDLRNFARFLWCSPLMFWITVTTAALFACRTMLSFQYNSFFETAFSSEAETAQFLGRYTQAALCGSLLVQLLVVNRLVALAGLRGAQLVYASLLASAAMLTLLPMTLGTAVLARLVENELRFALRNPVAQLIVNQFSKATRLVARAWSMGLLIPLSGFTAALVLAMMLGAGLAWAIPLVTAVLGLGYFTASLGLVRSLDEGGFVKQQEVSETGRRGLPSAKLVDPKAGSTGSAREEAQPSRVQPGRYLRESRSLASGQLVTRPAAPS